MHINFFFCKFSLCVLRTQKNTAERYVIRTHKQTNLLFFETIGGAYTPARKIQCYLYRRNYAVFFTKPPTKPHYKSFTSGGMQEAYHVLQVSMSRCMPDILSSAHDDVGAEITAGVTLRFSDNGTLFRIPSRLQFLHPRRVAANDIVTGSMSDQFHKVQDDVCIKCRYLRHQTCLQQLELCSQRLILFSQMFAKLYPLLQCHYWWAGEISSRANEEVHSCEHRGTSTARLNGTNWTFHFLI